MNFEDFQNKFGEESIKDNKYNWRDRGGWPGRSLPTRARFKHHTGAVSGFFCLSSSIMLRDRYKHRTLWSFLGRLASAYFLASPEMQVCVASIISIAKQFICHQRREVGWVDTRFLGLKCLSMVIGKSKAVTRPKAIFNDVFLLQK